MSTWKYEGKMITEISDMPENTIGFIYKIRKKITGQFYIGRKSLYSHRTLPPLKGTKRKRKVVKESNWKNYQSSHTEVKKWSDDDIEKHILRFCKTKKALTYYELEEQQDIDIAVIINEAVNLTKRFGSQDGHKYINAVLDRVGKTLRSV